MTIGGFFSVLGLLVLMFVYMFPAAVARDKKNAHAILALNFFLGWTVLGWIGALVWALCDAPKVGMPACRFCAEPIRGEAKRCRFCGKDQPPEMPFMASPPRPLDVYSTKSN